MKNGDLKRFYPVYSQEEKDFVRYDNNGNILVGQAINDNDAMSKKETLDAIAEAQLFVYKPGGSRTFSELGIPTEKRLGYVYNITDDFITNIYFREGAGINYPAGTDVTVIEENDHYYFDTYVGRFDYNILDNVPIINQDLDSESFTPTANTYYRHMSDNDNSNYRDGYIYFYNGSYYKIIDCNWVLSVNHQSPNQYGNVQINAVPATPSDFENKSYQLQILSDGTYGWVERVKLYQHFLEITTSDDTGTHIYLQFVAASNIPVSDPAAIAGLLSAAPNGINAHGYAKESGTISGHSSVAKLITGTADNFIPVLIASTGSLSNGASIAYNTVTITDTLIQIL